MMIQRSCYFCQRTLSSKYPPHWDCHFCAEEHQVYRVVTTYTDAGLLYVHIFINENIQVRMHMQENLTYVERAWDDPDTSEDKYLIKMEGFPITLSNAKQKIKLYLTFR